MLAEYMPPSPPSSCGRPVAKEATCRQAILSATSSQDKLNAKAPGVEIFLKLNAERKIAALLKGLPCL